MRMMEIGLAGRMAQGPVAQPAVGRLAYCRQRQPQRRALQARESRQRHAHRQLEPLAAADLASGRAWQRRRALAAAILLEVVCRPLTRRREVEFIVARRSWSSDE